MELYIGCLLVRCTESYGLVKINEVADDKILVASIKGIWVVNIGPREHM